MENKRFNLDQTTIKKLLTVYKLKIPEFQRNFVWKKQKKQQLLDSLFKGFPIGAITLYEDEDVYYIIDGLQRINTLNQYLSSPNEVISFSNFYKKVEKDIDEYIIKNSIQADKQKLKNYIKKWYTELSNLYGYEKVSMLFNILNDESKAFNNSFCDLQIVEDLLGILKGKIEITNDDIALIIYRGDKNDLPELFKNINTGSVALSKYEILQSVWNDYILDESLLNDAYIAFGKELDLVENSYVINAVKDKGKFDIFKNLIGLNHIICCNEKSDVIFKFPSFKKLLEPVLDGQDNCYKYFKNDGISFELYSTILCKFSNQIVKGVDIIFKNREKDIQKISKFVSGLNKIIIEAMDIAISELEGHAYQISEIKYHSLYVLAGIIFSKYDIDSENLMIVETEFNEAIFNECLNLKKHIEAGWFDGDNRQVGFFNIRIQQLLEMKKIDTVPVINIQNGKNNNKMAISINNDIVTAFTVKDFYKAVFEYMYKHKIDFTKCVPYATGKKRYLINTENCHINNTPFVAPIQVQEYYVETHKSKTGAVRDIYNFLKQVGADVKFV